MKLKKKNSRKKKDTGARSRKDRSKQFSIETSRLIESCLFVTFVCLVVVIAFLGQEPKGQHVILNQAAPQRIVAEFPFDYFSEIDQAKIEAEVRAQVPPVFRRSLEPFNKFENAMAELAAQLAGTQIAHESEGLEVLDQEIAQTVSEFITEKTLKVSPEAILELRKSTTPNERSGLMTNGMEVLRKIYEDGVYSTEQSGTEQEQFTVIQLVDENDSANLPNARSLENARIALRVRLNALSRDTDTARHLFELFNAGLKPNLLYSEAGTRRAIDRAISRLQPEVITFEEGDTLIEPGSIIAERDLERLEAYRAAELENGNDSYLFNELFLNRLILTLLLLTAVYIYLRQSIWSKAGKWNRAITVTAVSILLNLLLIRLITLIGDSALITNNTTLSLLPYIAPYAVAPILVSVLVGVGHAVLTTMILSVVFGILQGSSIEFFLIAFLSGIVGTVNSSHIRKRSQLVRAGLIAGATAAIAGAAIALMNGFSPGLVGQQTIMALIVGAISGILVAGILPVFEQIFKITTEITLLELTDFNHPLLRQMQLEAPGTYHHSLMVANLSENAAAAIGANPLLCRVCSFFHDIGKLVKPEYFTENQRDGVNPHDEKNPSMSALVIKAHVKEGVEMARQNKLPRVIIDVIRQHHGTSLIQYFYFQAKQRGKEEGRKDAPSTDTAPEEVHVDESTYRYDGPKPMFKESAIIFFADSVEAASRSLKKVTQPNVEELIDNIVQSRIDDGQLDECPLTFKELDQIKRSFIYTLLNMLHARVEYPKEETQNKELAQSDETAEEGPDATAEPRDKQSV